MDDISLLLEKKLSKKETAEKKKVVKGLSKKGPKADFKKRYGKDAESVKYGTATNIAKRKAEKNKTEKMTDPKRKKKFPGKKGLSTTASDSKAVSKAMKGKGKSALQKVKESANSNAAANLADVKKQFDSFKNKDFPPVITYSGKSLTKYKEVGEKCVYVDSKLNKYTLVSRDGKLMVEAASSVRLPTSKQDILMLAKDYENKAKTSQDMILRTAYRRKAAALQAQARTMTEGLVTEAEEDINASIDNILTNFDTLSKALYSSKFDGETAKLSKEIRYAIYDLTPKLKDFEDTFSKSSLAAGIGGGDEGDDLGLDI